MGKITLVLDLDETLIHNCVKDDKFTKTLNVDFGKGKTPLYIKKRPGLDQLLTDVTQKFEVVLFTSS